MSNRIRFDLGYFKNYLLVEIKDQDDNTVGPYLHGIGSFSSTTPYGSYTVEIDASTPVGGPYFAYLLDTGNSPMQPIGIAEFYWDGSDAIDANTWALLNSKIEPGYTLADVTRLNTAVLAGQSSQRGSLITFQSIDGSKSRVTATTTAEGNRTAVTLDANV